MREGSTIKLIRTAVQNGRLSQPFRAEDVNRLALGVDVQFGHSNALQNPQPRYCISRPLFQAEDPDETNSLHSGKCPSVSTPQDNDR